jgi:hypothetical protein
MKRLIPIIILILIFNIQFVTNAHAIGGLRQLFRGIVNIFKGGADDVIRKGDDLLKNIGKSKEEILSGSKSKGINKTILASGDEAKILETVGREEHSLHFASLKNNTRVRFIKKLKGKLGPDDIADLFDIEELISDSSSGSTNKGFYGVIMVNWIGKVYRNSNYYSNPELEEKMLLVCSTTNDLFYFGLLMEQEPKRAFLVEHKALNNRNIKRMSAQELAVLDDSEDVKIMSTLPEKNKNWPSHYFTIYKDQGFEHDQKDGTIGLSSIKIKTSLPLKYKYSCYKATNEGLL